MSAAALSSHNDARCHYTYPVYVDHNLPAAVLSSYSEMEEGVYRSLADLCRDATWLKSYIAASQVRGFAMVEQPVKMLNG